MRSDYRLRVGFHRWFLRAPARFSWRFRNRTRLVVLAYHDVVDVVAFRRQIGFLALRMRPIALDDALRAIEGSLSLPPRSVLVTFDDGDRSVYEQAMPILRNFGIPAVLFVVAGHVGTSRPLWFREVRALLRQGAVSPSLRIRSPDGAVRLLKRLPDANRLHIIQELRSSIGTPASQHQLQPQELREMEAAGIDIGNHTLTHPCLDQCTDEKIRAELTQAHEALREWLGHPPRAFSYPNGNGDKRAECILEALGYKAAFLFDHKVGFFPSADRFQISRVRVNSTTSLARFRSIVNGLHPFIHHALGRA